MIEQTLAIIRNTFFESIRQPIMLVLLIIATLAIILSNPLSAFTMENDQRMLIDIGLATIFLCGALLAAFIATNVLGREIHNKTALTVISKPVGRPLFVLGKFLGVAGAMLLATAYMSFVFLLVEQHTVLQTVRDPVHVPVIVFGVSAGVLGLAVGIWCNYFYGKVFSSTVIVVTTPLAGLAYLLSLNFRFDFAVQPISTNFNLSMWMALAALAIAILVLSAIAVAASTRLGQVLTLVITLGVFTLGMVSDHFIGRPIKGLEDLWLQRARLQNQTQTVNHNYTIVLESGETEPVSKTREIATVPLRNFATTGEKFKYAELKTAYAIVPNFQVLWLSDALTQSHKIPPAYIGRTITYGCLQVVAALSVAIILFQRREVG
ncbi:MAG: hypothetical protein JSV91_15275 [Phycisphaerales bacterium]|nr:MAG: hypothetical protein JSV91_15275 [Phycisphaerales bacterium]